MKQLITIGLFLGLVHYTAAQVGIGFNGTPSTDAVLEMRTTDKGFLVPKVNLTATNNQSPMTSPKESLLVYNTAIVNDVVPGFYYWSGTAWVRILTAVDLRDASLPWLKASNRMPEATNTDAIWRKGKVVVNYDKHFGNERFTALNDHIGDTNDLLLSSTTSGTNEYAVLQFLKGRGTSYYESATVKANDTLGKIYFRGINSVDANNVPELTKRGTIYAISQIPDDSPQTADHTSTSTPGELVFQVNSGTQVMALRSNGEVEFGQFKNWDQDDSPDFILGINSNGYLVKHPFNTLRPTPNNKLSHKGNGLFTLQRSDGSQEHYKDTAVANQTKQTIVDQLLINTSSSDANEKVRLHVKKRDTDLSPLKIANCPVYTDNSAATRAGLAKGTIYRTPKGKLKIVF